MFLTMGPQQGPWLPESFPNYSVPPLPLGPLVLLLLSLPSLVAQTVKNLPAMQETWALSLGREDPMEKGMATHSNTLAWRSPWTEEPGTLQSLGPKRIGHE